VADKGDAQVAGSVRVFITNMPMLGATVGGGKDACLASHQVAHVATIGGTRDSLLVTCWTPKEDAGVAYLTIVDVTSLSPNDQCAEPEAEPTNVTAGGEQNRRDESTLQKRAAKLRTWAKLVPAKDHEDACAGGVLTMCGAPGGKDRKVARVLCVASPSQGAIHLHQVRNAHVRG